MQEILRYFPDLTKDQTEKFSRLASLYTDWNSKINVISRKDIDNLYVNHVLHSLAIAKIIIFNSATSILDVGTGGGFPGIPLAILFPEVNFHLVDSIEKKIKVVKAVSEELALANITAEHTRVEQIKQKYDFVVSRAVTAFPEFVKMVRKTVSDKNRNSLPNGIIYLKGGEFADEIKQYKRSVEIFNISEFFSADFFTTKKIIYLPI
jgi:16S rRNA (guanine527-N7)-methyltransferase